MNNTEKTIVLGAGVGIGLGLVAVGAGWMLSRLIDKNPEAGKLVIDGLSEGGKELTDRLAKKSNAEPFGEVVKFGYDVMSGLVKHEIDEDVKWKNRWHL
jgi:hypothetical protein